MPEVIQPIIGRSLAPIFSHQSPPRYEWIHAGHREQEYIERLAIMLDERPIVQRSVNEMCNLVAQVTDDPTVDFGPKVRITTDGAIVALCTHERARHSKNLKVGC